MNVSKERFPQAQQAGRNPALAGHRQAGAAAEAEADHLHGRALEAQAEQTALMEGTPLDSQYGAALAAQVEAKHDQAERIEDRIESLIEQQASRMQQAQSNQPGFLSLPSARAKWQQQVAQQQSVMQRLQGRLEVVREIKDGMGIHGTRIEELATRKVRAQEPELVAGWEEMQRARREHEALQKKQEQEKRQKLEREQTQGRGLRYGLTQAR